MPRSSRGSSDIDRTKRVVLRARRRKCATSAQSKEDTNLNLSLTGCTAEFAVGDLENPTNTKSLLSPSTPSDNLDNVTIPLGFWKDESSYAKIQSFDQPDDNRRSTITITKGQEKFPQHEIDQGAPNTIDIVNTTFSFHNNLNAPPSIEVNALAKQQQTTASHRILRSGKSIVLERSSTIILEKSTTSSPQLGGKTLKLREQHFKFFDSPKIVLSEKFGNSVDKKINYLTPKAVINKFTSEQGFFKTPQQSLQSEKKDKFTKLRTPHSSCITDRDERNLLFENNKQRSEKKLNFAFNCSRTTQQTGSPQLSLAANRLVTPKRNISTVKGSNSIQKLPESIGSLNEQKTAVQISSRKKIPDFSSIHKKLFDKMESVTEHVQRKSARSKLFCGSVQKTEKPLAKVHPLASCENLNRFGFNVKAVSMRKEQLKHEFMQKQQTRKINTSRTKERQYVKGVRSNRRFDLLMQSREKM